MSAEERSGIEEPRLRPVGADGCSDAELKLIATQLSTWLDSEYPEDSLRGPHATVGEAAARHYAQVRASGVDDLGAVLLEVGGRLEGEMSLFSELFVGPWEVANKVSDVVLAGAFGVARVPSGIEDSFGRHKFIQRLLDGEVSREEMNGAVALTAGWRAHRFGWDGSGVRDAHFASFGDIPPDVVGELHSRASTASLEHMRAALGLGEHADPNNRRADELRTYIDTMHGFEISKVRRAKRDAAWLKLELVAMWLHLHGNF